MKNRWLNSGSMSRNIPDIPNRENNGTLNFGCTGVDYPFTFVTSGKFSGFDVEIATRFAAKMGMKLHIQTFVFSSLITAISSNKIDFAAGCIAITEERAKKMAFSNPYMHTNTAAVVLSADNTDANAGIINSVKRDFYNTFIQDGRYQLLIDGVGCTVKISIFSVLFGTLLGFLICWMRMSSRKWLVNLTKAYIYIFRGIPQVVLLMLLFYVVFASSRMDGVIVSIIGFSITFSAYVCEMFRSSIESVNKGQTEACLAMGFTPFQAFRYITFPITVQRVFPVYIGEVIALIKSTSIVGYIAVEDLTKMSDMIRSLTFDAFFSLIVVTIIYFILIILTISGLRTLQKKTAPKRNKFYKP